ncbi:hypothetical protein HID58_034380 [Brassica napus]|uniref:Uncharacterized protein n=1 Tax=Brassica napus TaxID=3708 RepID=A0ABQ8C1W8_BRANA|nr:hypothetical protein HID58_034380 [Brassica napus]
MVLKYSPQQRRRAGCQSGFPPTSDARFTNRWLKAVRRSGFPPTSDARLTDSCEIRYVCGGGILLSLNHLKGGGGQTWGMERMERGREMWLEDDCILKLLRNRSGRRSGVPPTSVAGLTGAGEVMLDPALVRLKPSNETTKTSRVLGLSIVETRSDTQVPTRSERPREPEGSSDLPKRARVEGWLDPVDPEAPAEVESSDP